MNKFINEDFLEYLLATKTAKCKIFARTSQIKFIQTSLPSFFKRHKSKEVIFSRIHHREKKYKPTRSRILMRRRRNKLILKLSCRFVYVCFFPYYKSWHFSISAFAWFRCYPYLHFMFPSKILVLLSIIKVYSKFKSRDRNWTKTTCNMFFNHVLSRRAKLKSQIQAHWSWQDN